MEDETPISRCGLCPAEAGYPPTSTLCSSAAGTGKLWIALRHRPPGYRAISPRQRYEKVGWKLAGWISRFVQSMRSGRHSVSQNVRRAEQACATWTSRAGRAGKPSNSTCVLNYPHFQLTAAVDLTAAHAARQAGRFFTQSVRSVPARVNGHMKPNPFGCACAAPGGLGYDTVHPSFTVLLEDERLSFRTVPYQEELPCVSMKRPRLVFSTCAITRFCMTNPAG